MRYGLSVSWLPYILCASDCISGLGSGMTIKYFPIWLFDRVGLQPSAVNFVQGAVPLAVAAGAIITQSIAGVAGVHSLLLSSCQVAQCLQATCCCSCCLLPAAGCLHWLRHHSCLVAL